MVAALPTGQRGRLLALSLTLVVLAAFWVAVVSPLIDLYGERADALEQRKAVATRMERLAALLPSLRERAATAESAEAPEELTIAGASDAVAAATLQGMVQDMATSAGVSLTSIEIVPAEAVGAYRRIGLKLALETPWTKLVALLQTIGEASPPMLIDDLQIHASPDPDTAGPQSLDTAFTVYALRAAASPAAAP
jgi:general secretion pathway protein M